MKCSGLPMRCNDAKTCMERLCMTPASEPSQSIRFGPGECKAMGSFRAFIAQVQMKFKEI